MTHDEARALVRASVQYQAESGNMKLAYARWSKANPGEAAALEQYTDTWFSGMPAGVPVLKTKFGQGLVGLMPGAAPPPPPPPPAPRIRGAMVVTAGNIGPQLLKGAGVSHVSVELNGTNLTELATWNGYGFVKGGLFISRGPDAVNEATHVSAILDDNPWLTFVVIDTECHKVGMGGQRVWTENLYRELRARKPLPFPIYNVTFGVDAAVDDVVNHAALRAHSIGAIWEAYDGSGATLGVRTIRDKAIAGGWKPPHIALGDKSLQADCAELETLTGVGDVWLWAPDNGPAVEALASGVKIP